MREETETDARSCSPPSVADDVALRICGPGRRNHSDDSLPADLLVSSVLWFAKINLVVIRLHAYLVGTYNVMLLLSCSSLSNFKPWTIRQLRLPSKKGQKYSLHRVYLVE